MLELVVTFDSVKFFPGTPNIQENNYRTMFNVAIESSALFSTGL